MCLRSCFLCGGRSNKSKDAKDAERLIGRDCETAMGAIKAQLTWTLGT